VNNKSIFAVVGQHYNQSINQSVSHQLVPGLHWAQQYKTLQNKTISNHELELKYVFKKYKKGSFYLCAAWCGRQHARHWSVTLRSLVNCYVRTMKLASLLMARYVVLDVHLFDTIVDPAIWQPQFNLPGYLSLW